MFGEGLSKMLSKLFQSSSTATTAHPKKLYWQQNMSENMQLERDV